MSVFDQELILPGVITDIMSDYNSGYDTSLFGTTDSVTIIGTAFNGPVGTPVRIYSPEHCRYVFGEAFDSANRKEATLVAEVQNAWDRGCKTIYAVRVSGKEIYKDFQIASDVDCKIRVSGIFPTNRNKDIYFEFDKVDTSVEEARAEEATIKIYKPADRATIEEKMLGKVTKNNSILVNIIKLRNSWNISPSSRLADFIKLFNEYKYNNVLRLSIVDNEGNDITDSALAQGLSFAELLPGVYFIGRDKNSANLKVATDVTSTIITAANKAQYPYYAGKIVKTIVANSDVTSDLPIYHSNVVEMNKLIANVPDVSMVEMFDFLNVPGKVDSIWLKDDIDYEEVDLSDFEMYTRLGSGFASTAKVAETSEGSGIYKVVEVTEENDENRVVGITDGIYSMLENLPSDYRVLAGKYADTTIKGKLPKKDVFKYVASNSSAIFSDVITATSKIDNKNIDQKKSAYLLKLYNLVEGKEILSSKTVLAGITSNSICKFALMKSGTDASQAPIPVGGDVPNGTLLIESASTSPGSLTLYKVMDGTATKITSVTDDLTAYTGKTIVAGGKIYKTSGTDTITVTEAANITDVNNAKYVVADILGIPVVCEVKGSSAIESVTPLATLEDILNEENSLFAINVPNLGDVTIGEEPQIKDHMVNEIQIRATGLAAMSLADLIKNMNMHKYLSSLFSFELSNSVTDKEKARASFVLAESGGVFTIPVGVGNSQGDEIATTTTTLVSGSAKPDKVFVDRGEIQYNKNLYVPYGTNDNFARQLAQHCVYTALKTAPTHGIIGCSKLMNNSLKSVADRVDKLASLDLNLYAKKPNGNDMLDRNNLPYPIGRAISITCFQNSVETGDNYTYISTGASAYAGMISTLPIDQSSTAQSINLPQIGYELTNYQLGRLTQAGFVTVKNSYTKGYVITDGVTMAPINSAFRRLSVTRIINGIDEAIRASAEEYIGKQNNLANRNSLQTSIKSSLDKMLDNLIEKYDFKLINDRSSQQLGIIEIEYTIVPINEIREVRNRITVKNE